MTRIDVISSLLVNAIKCLVNFADVVQEFVVVDKLHGSSHPFFYKGFSYSIFLETF